jgi:uncharacterized membrane protein (DUF485 family)
MVEITLVDPDSIPARDDSTSDRSPSIAERAEQHRNGRTPHRETMRPTQLRPRRRLAVPFLLVCYPLCWLVVRAVGLTAAARPTAATLLRAPVFAAGAVGVAYLVAVAVTPHVPDRLTPDLSRPTLLVAGALTLALATYVVVSSLVALPQWVAAPARAAGLVFGWPMAAVTLATYAVGNAVPAAGDAVGGRLLATLVGAALTAGWVLLLSDRVVRILSGGTRIRAD